MENVSFAVSSRLSKLQIGPGIPAPDVGGPPGAAIPYLGRKARKSRGGSAQGRAEKNIYFQFVKALAGWWSQSGSNRRPLQCHCSALPTELWPGTSTPWPGFMPAGARKRWKGSEPEPRRASEKRRPLQFSSTTMTVSITLVTSSDSSPNSAASSMIFPHPLRHRP